MITDIQPPPSKITEEDLSIAAGNTGTEALSALLASKKGEDDREKIEIEEFLESLHLSPDLEHLHVDIDAKFKEKRHEKGFKAKHGGIRWKIREVKKGYDEHSQGRDNRTKDHFAHLLNELNLRQQELDQLDREIVTHKKQLYADWNKYMNARYLSPEEINKAPFPPIDEVRFFIYKFGVEPLKELEERRNQAEDQRDLHKEELETELYTLQHFEIEDVLDWNVFMSNSPLDFSIDGIPHHVSQLTLAHKQILVDHLNEIIKRPVVKEHLDFFRSNAGDDEPVSYTHLTLPTIYSV